MKIIYNIFEKSIILKIGQKQQVHIVHIVKINPVDIVYSQHICVQKHFIIHIPKQNSTLKIHSSKNNKCIFNKDKLKKNICRTF